MDELTHYGIRGMRWGIRRTPAQLGNKAQGQKKPKKEKFNLSSMTDQELRDRVNRMSLERSYSSLTDKNRTRGFDYVKNALNVAGQAISISSSASKLGSGKNAGRMEKVGEVLGSSSKITNEVKRITNAAGRGKSKNDYGALSDNDLRNRVNRLNLERSFKDLAKGPSGFGDKLKTVVEVAGSGLAIASSSLAIALAIKNLKAIAP